MSEPFKTPVNPEDGEVVNGFEYADRIVELSELIRTGKQYDADMFGKAYTVETADTEEINTTLRADINPGEIYEPRRLLLHPTSGDVIFMFSLIDPSKNETEQDHQTQMGFYWSDMADMLPTFHAEIASKVPHLAKLVKKNMQVIGSRRKIIEAINRGLVQRSMKWELEREERLAKLRADFYTKSDDTGMF